MTTQIIWTKELYGTGVDLIDSQHQELFKRINAVLQAVETNARTPDVAGLLKSLEEYTISHFSCEEKLTSWLRSHIMTIDTNLKDTVKP